MTRVRGQLCVNVDLTLRDDFTRKERNNSTTRIMHFVNLLFRQTFAELFMPHICQLVRLTAANEQTAVEKIREITQDISASITDASRIKLEKSQEA